MTITRPVAIGMVCGTVFMVAIFVTLAGCVQLVRTIGTQESTANTRGHEEVTGSPVANQRDHEEMADSAVVSLRDDPLARFHDFRIGMTREELYEKLAGVELKRLSELFWEGFPERYGNVKIRVIFDDIAGIISASEGDVVTIDPTVLDYSARHARLIEFRINFEPTDKFPYELIKGIRTPYGKPQSVSGETLLAWRSEESDINATLHIEERIGLFKIHGHQGFHSQLDVNRGASIFSVMEAICKKEEVRLEKSERSRRAEAIHGASPSSALERLNFESQPKNPDDLIGQWVTKKIKRGHIYSGSLDLSSADGHYVAGTVKWSLDDTHYETNEVRGGVYDYNGIHIVLLRGTDDQDPVYIGVLEDKRIWAGTISLLPLDDSRKRLHISWFALPAPMKSDDGHSIVQIN